MAPGDVCHGPRCSLAGLGPAALGYRPCCWPGRSAGSPECARPMGCGFLVPVPRSPLVRTFPCVVLFVRCPRPSGSCQPLCSLGVLCCVACAVSWATWLLFTGVPARCVVLRVRCPRRLGSCSPVCSLRALCFVCGVLDLFDPVHLCARSVCCVVSCVRCPGPLGSCSPVCPLGVLSCVCDVLGHLAPVHRCARSVRCVLCAVSWASLILFTCVLARCVVLYRVCGVLGHLAPDHRRAHLVCCLAFAVFWASWLLFTGVLAPCVVLRVRFPGQLGSCSPSCPPSALRHVWGVLGHLAPVHRCALPLRCVACAVSWATLLLFTGVPAQCVVWRARCLGSVGSCLPVCSFGALCCVCGVVRHLASIHRCARSVCSVACAVSWATWLLFTGLPGRCVRLHVRCPGPLGFCSLECSLSATCCVCGVLGHLAPVHRCARSVRCVACVVSRATWLLFIVALPRCVVLRVRCPGPLGSCSPGCPLGALCCVCGVLGHLAPIPRCARSVRCAACAVSWAT